MFYCVFLFIIYFFLCCKAHWTTMCCNSAIEINVLFAIKKAWGAVHTELVFVSKCETERAGMVLEKAQCNITMFPLNETVSMPACYCKQNLAVLAPSPEASDWPTVLELTLSGVACKSLNSFNLTRDLKNNALVWDAAKDVCHTHSSSAFT